MQNRAKYHQHQASVINRSSAARRYLPTGSTQAPKPPAARVWRSSGAIGKAHRRLVRPHNRPLFKKDGEASQQVSSGSMRDNGEGQVCGCWSKRTAV
jgi:hypothetical protein